MLDSTIRGPLILASSARALRYSSELSNRSPLRSPVNSSSLRPPDPLPLLQPPCGRKSVHVVGPDSRLRRHSHYALRQRPGPSPDDLRLLGAPLPASSLLVQPALTYPPQTHHPWRRPLCRPPISPRPVQDLRSTHCRPTLRRAPRHLASRRPYPSTWSTNPGSQSDFTHGTMFWLASTEGLILNSSSVHAGLRTRLGGKDYGDYDADTSQGFFRIESDDIDMLNSEGSS